MQQLTRLISLIIAIFFYTTGFAASNTDPTGLWKTPQSILKVFSVNGEWRAEVVKVLNSANPNPLCTNCSGKRKNQPLIGMTVVWGLKAGNNEWEGGKVLEPQTGAIYDCTLQLSADGQQAHFYASKTIYGRMMTWTRVE